MEAPLSTPRLIQTQPDSAGLAGAALRPGAPAGPRARRARRARRRPRHGGGLPRPLGGAAQAAAGRVRVECGWVPFWWPSSRHRLFCLAVFGAGGGGDRRLFGLVAGMCAYIYIYIYLSWCHFLAGGCFFWLVGTFVWVSQQMAVRLFVFFFFRFCTFWLVTLK